MRVSSARTGPAHSRPVVMGTSGNLLDPALHQLKVGVAQAERVRPLSLGPRDVSGRGTTLGLGVCVARDRLVAVMPGLLGNRRRCARCGAASWVAPCPQG
jgi:hypothetical protein